MEGVFNSGDTTMINTRGRLVRVINNDVPLRKEEGWKIVINPRRAYFPEFDIENKGNKVHSVLEVDDDLEHSNVLQYEEV